MAELPSGTVTFLLINIEGGTALRERAPEAMRAALMRRDSLLAEATEGHGGHVLETGGDRSCGVFFTAARAVSAAAATQRAWPCEARGDTATARLRMAVHSGSERPTEDGGLGLPLYQAARLLAAAHGGQILLSRTTADLVRGGLPNGARLRDLGEHRLIDPTLPERIFQVVAPGLPIDFPPPKALVARPNNLPMHATPFIGREREVEMVGGRLLRPEVRLLTLIGPGGIGKTRLGLRVAAELLDEFEDGVYFVDLAPIGDPSLVVPAIAQAVGVREAGSRVLLESLKDQLRDKHMLLLLDNFEQVLEAGPLVGRLLAACPRLKALVTSRSVLRLYGSHDVSVSPLTLPDLHEAGALERLAQYEAIRLFSERARAAQSNFSLTEENAAEVVSICHQLEGLPLAIELAAARVRLFAPSDLLGRLGRRLPLLTGGPRDVPARQRALRATIDWSYHLLDPPEQALFRRLAAFVGGCTMEAAAAVCTSPELGIDLFDGIVSLADKSLLRRDDGDWDPPRFRMLETIREYGLERLEASTEAPRIRRRHAEHCLALAESAWPGLVGPDGSGWCERLESEHDNFRAALTWSQEESGDAELGLRLAGAVAWFWYVRGHFTEGRRWLDQALTRGRATTPSVQAKAFWGAGLLTRQQGDLALSEQLCEAALAIFQSLGDRPQTAVVQSFLAITVVLRGDYERATALFEQSLASARELDYRWCAAIPLQWRGALARARGDPARATALLEESLAIRRDVGETRGVAYCFRELGRVACDVGDYARAACLLEESLAKCRELGARYDIGQSLYCLGLVAHARGDDRRASAWFEESLILRREIGDRPGLAESLEACGAVACRSGLPEQAARLFGAAEILREVIGAPLLPADRAALEQNLATARRMLGTAAFAAAWAEGRTLSTDQAADCGLAVLKAAPATVTPVDVTPRVAPSPPLTPREREVAALVARGLTNRQIGEALVIAERTADAHIGHILTKLGFRSRAQIGAWAVEHHLRPASSGGPR